MLKAVLALAALAGCGRLGFSSSDHVVGDAVVEGNGDGGGGDGGGSATGDGGVDGAVVPNLLVQKSAVGFATGPQTLTLPAASTAGSLLVLTFGANDITSLMLPSGWMIATSVLTSGACAAAIAYYPNNPGGITSVMFQQPALQPTAAQLSEWAPITANRLNGTAQTNGGIQATMQTAMVATIANRGVAITAFCEDVNNPTYTPGMGWTNLGMSSNGPAEPSFNSDYKVITAGGLYTETVTSSVSGKYSAVIAVFASP